MDVASASDTEPSRLTPEQLLVRAWRRRRLLAAGLTVADARLLSESNADLHRALHLVEQGCPPELVAKVLL
jgi:hypothetical protein